MRRVKRQVGIAGSIATMALGALAITGAPSWAAAGEQALPACYVQGLRLWTSPPHVVGDVGRYNCGDWVKLTGEIFKDLTWWPDPQIAWNARWLYNGTVHLIGDCDGFGSYYTAATSSTNQYDESVRYGAC